MAAPDRASLLLANPTLTGVDFVYVHADQQTLDVFFLKPPADPPVLVGTIALEQVQLSVRIEGEPLPTFTSRAWVASEGRDVLRLTADAPGGFADYRLRIDDPRIDPFFNDVSFSFKANCPSSLDCEPPEHECPPEPSVDFPVDYMARDFWSFRRALLDFAAHRYPEWKDRLEADVGVMLVELMAALGDELAYYQDRVAREGSLETATQRRSLRRLARLVDHEIHDGHAAHAWLDVEVGPSPPTAAIPAGMPVMAASDGLLADASLPPGSTAPSPITFEVGRGLSDAMLGHTFVVDRARNTLAPHVWDQSRVCLPVGATSLHLNGHHQVNLPFDDLPPGGTPGRWVLLATKPPKPSIPVRRWLVRLTSVTEETDPLLDLPFTGHDVTRIAWEPARATPFELDLETLEVRGNLVPATAGRTVVAQFRAGEPAAPPAASEPAVERAVERTGPNGSVAYLFSLPESEPDGLVWLGPDVRRSAPEIRLARVTWNGSAWVEEEEWPWRRTMLGAESAMPDERSFTLDDGMWRRVVGYQRLGGEVVHRDYASGSGVTVRFGDGEFGLIPAAGTVFQVTYRVGNGHATNVSPDTLTTFAPPLGADIVSITNPLPAQGGVDPETPDQIRRIAPDAFREIAFRAVRPEDYAEAAERLPWVQRAGASFRWTGSWLSCFATPDTLGAVTLSDAHRRQMARQLDRFRQAGREVHVMDPLYADIDLEITICVAPDAYSGEVETGVMEVLFERHGIRQVVGFFHPNRFTFGTPLERAALEAVIQSVPGVRAVEGMRIRRRGGFDWRAFSELIHQVADNEIIRLQNDPVHPEQGTIRLVTKGGA